jgi:hypothetical protein
MKGSELSLDEEAIVRVLISAIVTELRSELSEKALLTGDVISVAGQPMEAESTRKSDQGRPTRIVPQGDRRWSGGTPTPGTGSLAGSVSPQSSLLEGTASRPGRRTR